MLNASKQCDMVELCLDKLVKEPNVPELIRDFQKPVIVSCRRQEDGGQWAGSEEDRIDLLRQACMAGPAYIELEPEIAAKLPRLEDTKLVVGFTSLQTPLDQIDSLVSQAAKLNADIVKLAWPTPTLDEAWPLLSAISKKKKLPIVGMGLGRAGLTFSLVACRYDSPWTYAALEEGMEAFPGQVTVRELDETYDWRNINSQTGLIGVLGFGLSQLMAVQVFNAGFRKLGMNARCLPLEIGKFDKLARMLDALQIRAVFTSTALGEHVLPLAEFSEESADVGQNTDLLLKKDKGWHAYNNVWRSAIKALERTLAETTRSDHPLSGRDVLVYGSGRLAQSMVYGLQQRGARIAVTCGADAEENVLFCAECGASMARDISGTQFLAQTFKASYLPFELIYQTSPEVAVFADPGLQMGYGKSELNPFFLRPPLTVIDVSTLPEESNWIVEARRRGCTVVEPAQVYADQLASQFKSITGNDLPTDAILTVPTELHRLKLI